MKGNYSISNNLKVQSERYFPHYSQHYIIRILDCVREQETYPSVRAQRCTSKSVNRCPWYIFTFSDEKTGVWNKMEFLKKYHEILLDLASDLSTNIANLFSLSLTCIITVEILSTLCGPPCIRISICILPCF